MKIGSITISTNMTTRWAFHSTLLPWLVLALGIPASFFLFKFLQDSVENVARLRFEREAKDANSIIEGRLRAYGDVLYALRALFASEDPVDRLRFHRFIESLDVKHRYPGFISLNYAAYFPARDKKRLEEAVRRDTSLDPQGYPKFAIKPPGERPEYYAIVYLEPMAGYEFAFGLDLGATTLTTNPEKVAAAIRLQRDSGKLITSAQPLRVKRATEAIYLAMRLAVYRKGMPIETVEQRQAAYLGSVGSGFDVESLIREALNEEMLRHMRIRLYDSGSAVDSPDSDSLQGKRLLFDSDRRTKGSLAQPAVDSNSIFVHALPIEIASRVWEFEYSARKDAVISALDKAWPFGVLAGGLLSSLLLFGVFYSLSSSRSQALKLAAQMTKDLRETEERFRRIAENASDLIALIDPQGRRVYVNPAYDTLFGDHKAMVGTDSFEDVHPEDRERVRKSFFDTVNDGKARRTEFRFLLPNGEERHIESQASSVLDSYGKVALVVRVSRDVTERRKTYEALRARDLQLQEAQAVANLGIWERDVRKDLSTWSDQLYRIFGVTRDQFTPSREEFLALVHPEDRARVAMSWKSLLESGPSLLDNQFRIVRPDGTVRTVYTRLHVDRDGSGRAVRILGVCQDVTDRKLAEEEARATEERFRTMVENVRDYAIYMLDPRGYITSWNLGAERIKGYLADETIGRHYSLFFLPEHTERGDPGLQLEFAAIQGRYESEGWSVRKDGSRFWAHVIVTRLLDESGKLRGFSRITHDITERRRAEEDLHSYADRLRVTSRRLVEVQEAERRLLAGELHDRVGQNLTALGLNLSIVASGLPAEDYPELAARLEESSVLVQGTVDAMRNVMAELRPHALDDYGLPAALRTLAASFSRRTGIQVAFQGDAPATELPKPVDLAMFRIAQEALNNVAKHSNADHVEIAIKRVNGLATLSVRDNGVGFDPRRIGASNNGAGWGLLIMRERAEAVGAGFSLHAEPDAGVQVLVEYHVGAGG